MHRTRWVALALMAALGVTSLNLNAAGSPETVSYVRLGPPDANGISRFTDETLTLAQNGGPGLEGVLATHRLGDIKGVIIASLKAGATEDWHPAPRRQFMFCLRGIVEVTAGDGQKRRIMPGQFVLLEDTSGKGHITHSAGTEDHVALAIPVPDGVPAKN
jgi:quercetin dioxygenase-like cupin family protein